LRLNPNSDHALFRLSWLYFKQQNYDAALKSAEAAARISADDEANLYTLAWAQYHNGKLKAALQTAQRALKLDPENAELHELMADLTFNQGQYKEAEQHYRVALRHDPENASAHLSLGECLAAQERIREAADHIFAAVKIDPANDQLRQRLFDIVHHEIMDQPLQSQKILLRSLDPAVRHFYQDQLGRKDWFEKIRIGSVVSLWVLGLGILMVFFTIATGDDASKMIRFVVVVGFIYLALFIAKLVLAHIRKRKS